MLVLWLLLLRGIALEFRHQVTSVLWHEIWDVVFFAASALLAILFGVAFGNVLRGVPLDARGEFQGSFALMLNPFALLGGVLSLATLSLHGAAWLALKTDGELQRRARRLVTPLWGVAVLLFMAMIAASFVVRPDFTSNFVRWPWLAVFPLVAIAAIVNIRRAAARGSDGAVFMWTSAFIIGVLTSAAAGLFPMLLPALDSPRRGLDIYNAAAPINSMRIALGIYLFGMLLVTIYLINIYRIWRGKAAEYHV
jgi:cytochrome d ubiquinol oxidase subunit II